MLRFLVSGLTFLVMGFGVTAAYAESTGLRLPRRPIHFNDRQECRTNPEDRFQPGAVAFAGLDEGKCLDVSYYRPIVTLFPDEAEAFGLRVDSGRVVVANVRDYEGFVVAEIPLGAAQRMNLLIEHFMDGMPEPGHGAFRVFFSEPVRIRPQVGVGRSYTVNELIFSIHANDLHTGSEVSPAVATRLFDRSYALVLGVFTPRARVADAIVEQGNQVEQWQVDMPAAQVSEFARRYLIRSNSYSLSRGYHLTNVNCITELFDILDGYLSYSRQQRGAMAGGNAALGRMIPIKTPAALKARGLLRDDSRMVDLADDPSIRPILDEIQ